MWFQGTELLGLGVQPGREESRVAVSLGGQAASSWPIYCPQLRLTGQ